MRALVAIIAALPVTAVLGGIDRTMWKTPEENDSPRSREDGVERGAAAQMRSLEVYRNEITACDQRPPEKAILIFRILAESPGSVMVRLQPAATMSQTTPSITVYLKTFCGWSQGVRAILAKYELPYEEKDIIKNPAFRWEMEQRSGQSLSPCVLIDGQMLADVSGAEVEAWLVEHDYVRKSEVAPAAPIDSSCSSGS